MESTGKRNTFGHPDGCFALAPSVYSVNSVARFFPYATQGLLLLETIHRLRSPHIDPSVGNHRGGGDARFEVAGKEHFGRRAHSKYRHHAATAGDVDLSVARDG